MGSFRFHIFSPGGDVAQGMASGHCMAWLHDGGCEPQSVKRVTNSCISFRQTEAKHGTYGVCMT